MKKKTLIVALIALVAVLATAICLPVLSHANEVEDIPAEDEELPPTTEEVPPTEGEEPPTEEAPTVDEAMQRLNAVLAWLEEQAPLLSSLIVSLILAVVGAVEKIKRKQSNAFYTKEKEKNAQLVSVLEHFSIEELYAKLVPIIEETLQKKVDELQITDAVYADMNAKLEMVLGSVHSLIRGATNAWHQSPAAVAELTQSDSEVACYNLALQVASLEKLLYAKYGAEAKDMIEKARAGEVEV